MFTALLLTTVALFSQGQATKRYDLPQIALSFDCPTNWTISTDKKGDTKAFIPLEGSSEKAELDIYPANFVSEKEIWQLSQATMVQQMKRKLEEQSEEVILGVPLLLTKFSYDETNNPKVCLVGLIYNAAPRKLYFRLTASAEDFDKAEFSWRQAMQTLRTFDGRPAKPQDPTVKVNPGKSDGKKPPVSEDLPTKPPTISEVKPANQPRPIKKAEQVLAMSVANRDLKFYYPTGWTAVRDDKGVITLTHPGVKNPIKMTLSSTLDSDPPAKALFKVSSATLDDYTKVNKRDEVPGKNLPGSDFIYIWRSGVGQSGPLYTCDAVGWTGDFYWMIAYRSDSPASVAGERKLLEALIDQMSVEQTP